MEINVFPNVNEQNIRSFMTLDERQQLCKLLTDL